MGKNYFTNEKVQELRLNPYVATWIIIITTVINGN